MESRALLVASPGRHNFFQSDKLGKCACIYLRSNLILLPLFLLVAVFRVVDDLAHFKSQGAPKITAMDPAKLAKLQAQAAANRIGEPSRLEVNGLQCDHVNL